MITFIQKIKNFFASREEPLVLPDALVYSEINWKEIEKKLQIRRKGSENGSKNLPSTNSSFPDSIENDIQTEIMKVVRPNLQNYDSQMAACRNLLSSIDPLTISSKLKGEITLQINQLKAQIQQEKGNIFLIKQSLIAGEIEWNQFKEKWGLVADPIIKLSKLSKWSIILLIIALESLANALQIGPYMEGGEAEAWGVSFVFSFVNIYVLSQATGILWRMLMIPQPIFKKMIFVSGIITSIALSLLLSFLLSYIRVAVINDQDWSEGINYLLMVFNGNFVDLSQGFILLILSLAAFAIGVYDFYKLDHPVPGLLDKFNQRKEQHQKYNDRLISSQKALLNINQESVRLMKAIYDNLDSKLILHNNTIDGQNKLWINLQSYLNHVELVVNNLFKIYRESNSSERTEDAPSYFKENWSFPLVEYRIPLTSQINGSYSDKIKKTHAQIKDLEEELHKELRAIPDVVLGIDELLISVKG